VELDRETIGERLLQYRNHLNITQNYLCQRTGIAQNSISLLERGGGGGFDSFFTLLKFYSESFDVHNILHEKFTVIERGDDDSAVPANIRRAGQELEYFREEMGNRLKRIQQLLDE